MLKVNEKTLIYTFLCLGCITISFNVAAIAAAIPAISLELRLSDFLVSKIIPYYMVPYGIGALFYAPLTRRFSYRWVLSLPILLYALACFYGASIHSLDQLLTGRIAMGICGASTIPLGLIVIGQLFEKNVRGRLVGFFFGCSFFASIAGIVVAGIADWRLLFFIPGMIGTFTAIGLFFLKTKLLDHVYGVEVNYLESFRHQRIRELFVFIFAISFFYHGVHKWFGIYLDRIYGLDKLTISIFFILMSIGGAAGQLIGGQISDKKGRLSACMIGIFLLSFSTMLLVGKYPLVVLGALFVFLAMGWTIGHNGISTVLTDFEEKHRPAMASLNSSVRFVSGGIGFFVSSFFVEKSFGLTFFIIGLLMFCSSRFLRKIIPA